jgi:hypothetical protein
MQTFVLTNPETKEVITTADNLNRYSCEYIKCVIDKQISKASWKQSLCYTAIGSEGDTVIYHNDTIHIC